MPRVLLTGASGLLGRAVYKEFKQNASWEILGLSYSRVSGELQKVDLTKRDQMEAVVAEYKPNIVIHAAAERRPDVVDKQQDATRNLNVIATENICKAAAAVNASVLYISTDYVFDGNDAPYSISASPNPLNYYGVTKLEGEQATMAVSAGNMILRVPILYGDVEYVKESAVTILYEAVKDSSKESQQDDYQRRFPTHVSDIASVIRQLLDKRIEDQSLCGIFHWSGRECFTKYSMCNLIADALGLSSEHFKAVKTPPSGAAKRPYDANLSRDRLEKLVTLEDTPFREGIKQCLQPYL